MNKIIQGDCLEAMATLPDRSIGMILADLRFSFAGYNGNIFKLVNGKMKKGHPIDDSSNEIVRLYCDEKWTLRRIAERFSTNHHMIKRILENKGVTLDDKGRRFRKP